MTIAESTPRQRMPAPGEGEDHLINNTDSEIELVPPGSITAEQTGRFTFLPVNGAAFVMQVMHPVIGDVVGKYSVFRTDPGGRAIRSIDSVLRWVYGGEEALAEGKRLRKMHQPLQMKNAQGSTSARSIPRPTSGSSRQRSRPPCQRGPCSSDVSSMARRDKRSSATTAASRKSCRCR